MTIGEATRQYQIALEHRRWTINLLGDVLSAEDEVNAAKVAEVGAWRETWLRWLELSPEQIGVA
jgi:hypothetical protein